MADTGISINTGRVVVLSPEHGKSESWGRPQFALRVGTEPEISLVWNKMQTHVLEPRPLVLLGDCWPPVVSEWQRSLAVSDADVAFLKFADKMRLQSFSESREVS